MRATPLHEALSEAEFGGKAVQLGAAIRARLPVPPGIALAADVVDAIAAAVTSRAHELADAALVAARGWAAVRSSAVGEDGENASFAGQHLTVLGARSKDQVLEAIQKVWQSARSPSALAYRARVGASGPPAMGIVVQALVKADVAGVLFTENPMTGADERVIEGSWGLGEVVVAGLVTPDRFRVGRCGTVLESCLGEKDIEIAAHEDGSTYEREVPTAKQEALCLTPAQLACLCDLAARAESHFGGTQDLEWAFAGDELFLLQRRAITRSAKGRPLP